MTQQHDLANVPSAVRAAAEVIAVFSLPIDRPTLKFAGAGTFLLHHFSPASHRLRVHNRDSHRLARRNRTSFRHPQL